MTISSLGGIGGSFFTPIINYPEVAILGVSKSNKKQIKKSVEEIFKVKVKSINTLRRKGKSTNFRNIKGKRKDFKHAIITLEEGQTIDTMGSV